MATHTISNASSTATQISQQKTGTGREQAQGKAIGTSVQGNGSRKQHEDTVTLSKSGRPAGDQAGVLDTQAVEQTLPRTRAAIIAESKTAVATQANISSRNAREMLSD